MDYEEEWEFLPDSRFLDFPENSDERKIFSGKQRSLNLKSVFDNYIMCPSPSPQSKQIIEQPSSGNVISKQFVAVPIHLEPAPILKQRSQESEADEQVIVKKPTAAITESDQDSAVLSQVFFKKMKDNEFVDMKILDSPKSPRNNNNNNNNIITQIDAAGIDNMTCSQRKKMMKKLEDQVSNMNDDEEEKEIDDEGLSFGLNLWKWSLTGIGAICSFGVAAATICVITLGNQHKIKHHHKNQKLPFQIYSDDKRIKQVVQHAARWNEAISAVRGVPITRAHITYGHGGYYDDAL